MGYAYSKCTDSEIIELVYKFLQLNEIKTLSLCCKFTYGALADLAESTHYPTVFRDLHRNVHLELDKNVHEDDGNV